MKVSVVDSLEKLYGTDCFFFLFSESYNHGSAQNIDIVSKFMCDALVNSCGADQTARTTCASAQVVADQQADKTGAQADAFNGIFGITTNFSGITPLDDQGRPVTNYGPISSDSGASGPANFGKCSTPEIKFAAGLDGRKETAFAPVDQGSGPDAVFQRNLFTLIVQARTTMAPQTTLASSYNSCVTL